MLIVNKYFDGKVASIALQTETLPATVGVMDVGKYTFETSQSEEMTVISGQLTVKLPGTNDWLDFINDDSFDVAAGKTFELKVPVQTAYFCTYSNTVKNN